MMLSSKQINKSIDWLISNASPTVKYLTYKYLVRKEPNSLFMKNLWIEVENSKEVARIFKQQKENGSWCIGGSTRGYGYDPSEPKYVTTAWILPVLAEMGFTIKDKRIQKAVDYILNSWLFESPIFEKSSITKDDMSIKMGFNKCRFNWFMIGLASVGCTKHKDVKRGFEIIAFRQREDGGWVIPCNAMLNKNRSCPWATYGAAMALYYSKDKSLNKYLSRAFEFLSEHLEKKNELDLRKVYYNGHNLIRELLVMSEINIGLNKKNIMGIHNWLFSMYQPDIGCFEYTGKKAKDFSVKTDGVSPIVAKYHSQNLLETDWFTYYMTRIAINLKRRK